VALTFVVLALALTAGALSVVLAPLMRGSAGPRQAAMPAGAGAGRPERAVAVAAALFAAVGTAALYLLAGDPSALRSQRTDEAVQLPAAGRTADPAKLVAELRAHLARSPGDRRAWLILARLHFAADRPTEAVAAFEHVLEGDAPITRDPGIWCEYADALGTAQGGRLSGRPLEAVRRALALDPTHAKALELAGSAAIEQGDYAEALRQWGALLGQLESGSPRHAELLAAIERLEARSGLMRETARRGR
jgi:cytochrome c-type biogenesis protein CcmH